MNVDLTPWSAKDRAAHIRQLAATTFDVLIIGGGITGAGILRECGLNGLKAALIEKEDFAFGTSAKSTRLAHGGLRYIMNGEFGLVWEETHERDWMRNAFPNMVRPVPIIFSNYSTKEAVAAYLVLRLYDLLSGWKNYRPMRYLSRKAVEAREPNVDFTGLHSGLLFYECIINDARLTAEIVKEGVMRGGLALNYLKAVRVRKEDERAVAVEALDRETGQTVTIRAKQVVNATGPWTDELLPETYGKLIQPSKGVHIVTRRESIGNKGGLYVKSPVDRRSVFVLAHGDFTYVGTTDTYYTGDLDHCYTEPEEYAYFKNIVKHCFPQARFEPEDLLGSYAGSRPLVKEEGIAEGKVSRREYIDEVFPGFFVITGGKLTIFRAMGAKLLAFMHEHRPASIPQPQKKLSRSPFKLGMSRPAWDKLIAASGLAAKTGLDQPTLTHLYENYGAGALAILGTIAAEPALAEKITAGQAYTWAELEYALEYELIVHVKDFLLRRTNLSLHQREHHQELGLRVAERMARYLGWDEARIAQEVADYTDLAHKNKFFLKK